MRGINWSVDLTLGEAGEKWWSSSGILERGPRHADLQVQPIVLPTSCSKSGQLSRSNHVQTYLISDSVASVWAFDYSILGGPHSNTQHPCKFVPPLLLTD